MSLKEKIEQDFKQAFKNKETEKKEALSMIRSEIKNKEIELGVREQGLSDDDVVAVLLRNIKQRKDSVIQYSQGGREDLAQKEQQEIDIFQEYLPEQMSDAEVEKEISSVMESVGAKSSADLGKVMGVVMGKLKGKADGTKVREIAQKLLHDRQ